MLVSQNRREGIVAAMLPHFTNSTIIVNANPNYRLIAGEVVFAKDANSLVVNLGPIPESDQHVIGWVQTNPRRIDFTQDFVHTVYHPEKTSKK